MRAMTTIGTATAAGAAAVGSVGCVASSSGDGSLITGAPPRDASFLSADARSNIYDAVRADVILSRREDWRVGPVVYQVIVDRFAPSSDLMSKRGLYAEPRRLRSWEEDPTRGEYLPESGVWSHEVDFWGGDLQSLRDNLGYIDDLGADVLYLNPVKYALTNHKYDATDYLKISPEYGDREALRELTAACNDVGVRVMLDGVFNHTGRNASWFEEALADPSSVYRAWYDIDDRYPRGYRSWYNTANLPELNLENPDVRAFLWEGEDSVVKSFLHDGVAGWRLDVAYDLGFRHLTGLREAAQSVRSDAWIIGEIWSYPEEWSPALDGVMNFHARAIVMAYASGEMPGRQASALLSRMIEDYGIEPALRSWLVLDNHDTARLRHMLPSKGQRRLAQVLQFTLPGAPVVYYGTEIGMDGGDEPASRGPFRWSWIDEDETAAVPGGTEGADATPEALHARAREELVWTRSLIQMRESNPALRYGDYRVIDTQEFFAFQRRTDKRAETVIVIANNSNRPVRETISVRDSKQMGYAPFVDVFTGDEFRPHSGLLTVELDPMRVVVLRPAEIGPDRYSPFKRMR